MVRKINEARYNNPLPASVRKQANRICQKYNGYHLPQEVRNLWDELEELGIDVGMLTNRKENGAGGWSVEQSFDYNGERCDNSVLVFDCYEGNPNTLKNDYTIYIS